MVLDEGVCITLSSSNFSSGKKDFRRKIWLPIVILAVGVLAAVGFVMRHGRNIAMSVQNATPASADLIIDNQSSRELEFGEDYAVQFHDGQRWISVESQQSQGFGLVGYSLLPGESRSFHLSWENLYGSLIPGHYRVSKRFSLCGMDRVCYAEFSLTAE